MFLNKMVSLDLPSKGGKHAVTTIWHWETDLATEINYIMTDVGCHYKSNFL